MSYSWRFLGLVGVFVTTLVVSNIVAVKLVEVSSRVFDAGNILFPLDVGTRFNPLALRG